MYEGYLQLGGVEIANSDRVANYVKKNLPEFPLRDCIECGDLREALGDPIYESPLVDNAPWVDESDTSTYDFYGFYPLEITGVGDSTRQASVTESIGDGGFIGPLRYGTREIRVKGILVARNELSLEAGLTWLRMALNPSACGDHGGTCGGAKMCYYAACPTIDLTCFQPTGKTGPVTDIISITPETSPTLFNLPNDPGAYRAFYKIQPTDGLVFGWGRRKLLTSDIIEYYGNVVSRRTNYLPNPSFTNTLDYWSTDAATATRQLTGGVDGGAYVSIAGLTSNLATNPLFETVDPTPVVDTTNQVTNPSFETPGAAVTVRTNLCTNPSFEDGTTTGWDYNALAISNSTAWAASGTQSIRATASLGVNSDIRAANSGVGRYPFGIQPGDTVTFSATGHQVAAITRGHADSGKIGIGYYPTTGGAVWAYSPAIANEAGETRVSVTVAIPATGVNGVMLLMRMGSTVLTDEIWWDDILIEKSPTADPYFDGSTPAAGDFSYAWTGTPAASTSTQLAAGADTVTGGPDAPSFQSIEWVAGTRGAKSLRITSPGKQNDTFASVGGDAGGMRLGMAAGKTYTVGATCRLAGVQNGVLHSRARRVVLVYRDGSGDHEVLSPAAPNEAGETELRATFTLPADTTEAYLRLYNGSLGGGGDVWWDHLFLVEVPAGGSYTGPYFDGGTDDTDVREYAWTGTADASTSTRAHWIPAGAEIDPAQGIVWSDTENPHEGTRIARFAPTTTDPVDLILTDAPGAASGELITASMWARVNSTQSVTPIMLQPQWRAPDGTTQDAGVAVPMLPTDGWVLISRAGAAPFADAQLSIHVVSGHTVGDTIDLDDHGIYTVDPGSFRSDNIAGPATPVGVSYALRGEGAVAVVELRTSDTDVLIQSATHALSADWARYGFRITLGRGMYLRFIVDQPGYDIDQVLLEPGTLGLPYFDGDSDANAVMDDYRTTKNYDYEVSWLGTPHASRSRILWLAESIGSDGMQQFSGEEVCDPFYRPYIDVAAGEIRNGKFWYTVREVLPVEAQVEPYERHYHDVTAIEGPAVIERYSTSKLRGAAMVVDFTLVAATPFAYSRKRTILGLPVAMPHPVPRDHLPTYEWVDQPCTIPASGPILDPDCPAPPAPPKPPAIDNPCIDDPPIWARAWLSIPATEVSAWSSMLPTVIFSTGATAVRQARVRFYPNPFNYTATGSSRKNLVRNPRVSAALTDYTAGSSGTGIAVSLTRVTTTPPPGVNAYARVQVTTAPTGGTTYFAVQNESASTNLVIPGKTYTGSAYMRGNSTGTDKLYLVWLDAAGATVGTAPGSPDAAGSTNWIRRSVSGVAPTGAVRVRMIARRIGALAVGNYVDASAFQLEETTTMGSYFDGATTDAAGIYYGWGGTADLSVSVAAASTIDPCSYCAEFVVSYVPAYTQLTVDGMVKRAYASVKGGPERPASNLLYAADGGPMSWAELSCGIAYAVSVDLPPGQVSDVEYGLAMTRQE